MHAITYTEDGLRKIQVFGNAAMYNHTQVLVALMWTGSQWVWGNHGIEDVGPMAPVTFVESGMRKIYLFMMRGDYLYVRYWDGVSWKLENLGEPVTKPSSGLAAVTYLENGQRRIRAFTQYDRRIYSKSWNGSTWSWFDHGNEFDAYFMAPVSYTDARSGSSRIQLFATRAGGLMRHYYNGSSWNWFDQGSSP